jgi:hypothetical protein
MLNEVSKDYKSDHIPGAAQRPRIRQEYSRFKERGKSEKPTRQSPHKFFSNSQNSFVIVLFPINFFSFFQIVTFAPF